MSQPSADDIAQIVAYAEAKGCSNAILIYPSGGIQPMDEEVGGKRVRSLSFSVSDDLDSGGKSFLENLLPSV